MPRTNASTQDAIRQAVERLRAGDVVAVPTETVYGLAADAMNEHAVRRVFELKGRPATNPLIVHVLGASQARELVTGWDGRCNALAERFWPGPLTIILPKTTNVPNVVTAGWPTVGVRAPSHDVMRTLLEQFGGALAAPSANRSTSVSPTTAAHVADEFSDIDDLLILDGGPCTVGIESTVLDMTASPPAILRHGGISIEQLREELPDVVERAHTTQTQSPGTSPRHYAPRTPSELLAHDQLKKRLSSTSETCAVICFDAALATPGHIVIVLPEIAERYATMLYEALRRADASDADVILIERPARTDGLWAAIQDRLRRATTRA